VNAAARYFDHAATTPCDPQVLAEMLPYFGEHFGNAHSLHSFGKRAEYAVETARARIAEAIGADDPLEIFFTSGATEGNNQIVRAFSHVGIGPTEHSSVRDTALVIGHSVWAPGRPYDLVSIMGVNNETGEIPSIPNVADAVLHQDLTQTVGKIPFSLPALATFSGHKLYGPKGVGVTYVRGAEPLEPLLHGGDQERGYRSGTLNVPAIVGMGLATLLAMERQPEDFEMASHLREIVVSKIRGVSDWQMNANGSPFILSLSFAGIEGELVVLELDHQGFAISAGAACSSRSTEPSHVLLYIGLSETLRRGTVRISFGRANTEESARDLGRALAQTVERLRNLGMGATF
jgi:cysteine desulfurase